MLPSWQLSLNTLAGKPGRSALMIGAVALAASLVVAVSCAIGSVQASMEYGITRLLGAADARIIHPGNGRFDDAQLEQVRDWPEVRLATGRVSASLTLTHADRRKHPETGQTLRVTPVALGVDFALEPEFRAQELVAGARPTSPDEILIDPVTAEELQADVGDVLSVQRFGEPITLRVSGIYERQRLGLLQRPLIEADRATLANAADRQDQLTSIVVILNPGVDVNAFCQRYAEVLPAPLVLEPSERVRSGFDRQVVASRFGFTVGSVLTFISASFIIVTALTTSVTERQREMAVTRCVGGSRGQLFAAQLVAGLIMSAAGAAIGIPVGIGLTALLVAYFADLLPAGLQVAPLGLVLAVAGSAAAGLLGALYPAFMASRVSPLQALTYRARSPRWQHLVWCALAALVAIGVQLALMQLPTADSRFLAYMYAGLPAVQIGYFVLATPIAVMVGVVVSPLLSRALRLPAGMLRGSLAATPFRHGFTAGALMVGMAILVSTWGSMTSIMHDWLGKIRFADGFAYRTTGITPAQQQAIAGLPFITETCPISYLPVRVVDRQVFGVTGIAPSNVTCAGFDPDVFFRMNAVDWTAGDPQNAIARLKDGSGLIVADRFLTTQRVQLGDTLTLGVGRVQKSFEVVGAVNSAGLDIATQLFGIRSQYMEYSISTVFMDFETVREVFDNHDAYLVQVNFDPSVSDEEISERIGEVAPGVQFKSGRAIMDTANEVAGAMLTVQSVVAFAALVLASFAVSNVIIANIHGRRYEYGVLRAVGSPRSLLTKLVLCEAAIIALTGALVGTMLGLHLAWVGATHYRDLAGLPMQLRFAALPAAVGALVLLILTLLAAVPGLLTVVRRHPAALLAAGRNG